MEKRCLLRINVRIQLDGQNRSLFWPLGAGLQLELSEWQAERTPTRRPINAITANSGQWPHRAATKIDCPFLGVILEKAYALSVRIISSISVYFNALIKLEVNMISIILWIRVMVRAALLGRSS